MAIKKRNSGSPEQEVSSKEVVYMMVTKRILDNMIKGEIPWRQTYFKPNGGKPPYRNHVTGKGYSFINCMLLGEPGEYATWDQIKEKGGVVNKDAKSKIVIYWGEFIPKDRKEKAKELEEKGESFEHLKVKFPKYYRVFNIKDTTGLKSKDEPVPVMEEAEDPTAIARMVISDYEINQQVPVRIDATFDPAYRVLTDEVEVPEKANYSYEEDWYASVFSGFIHSTATEKRCNRETEYKKMCEGETSIKEELIAEIGSSMALSACGLKRKETHLQIDAVCQKFINAMNNDYRLIVNASYAAEKAARCVLGQFAE